MLTLQEGLWQRLGLRQTHLGYSLLQWCHVEHRVLHEVEQEGKVGHLHHMWDEQSNTRLDGAPLLSWALLQRARLLQPRVDGRRTLVWRSNRGEVQSIRQDKVWPLSMGKMENYDASAYVQGWQRLLNALRWRKSLDGRPQRSLAGVGQLGTFATWLL